MQVIEKEQSILIKTDHKFPIKKILVDAGIVLILVWGVFSILVIYLSHPLREILPYFIAITLLLIIPLTAGVLIRKSRHYHKIFIDGENRFIFAQGLWRKQRTSFDDIDELQVNKYRYKKGLFLYRLEAFLASGKSLRLIQDVPDKHALRTLGRKIEKLVNRPLSVN